MILTIFQQKITVFDDAVSIYLTSFFVVVSFFFFGGGGGAGGGGLAAHPFPLRHHIACRVFLLLHDIY